MVTRGVSQWWPDHSAVPDNAPPNVAYAATFNGEQDVYFLRIEVDCNENGTSDVEDISRGYSEDCDGNGTPDDCQPDCNSTGIADVCDIAADKSMDCDGNHNPDECDPDFDGDGLVDGCDDDVDEDGVPNEVDVCDFTKPRTAVREDGRPLSDTTGNCDADLADYGRFRSCFLQSGPAVPTPTEASAAMFDYNNDEHIDLTDSGGFMPAFTGHR